MTSALGEQRSVHLSYGDLFPGTDDLVSVVNHNAALAERLTESEVDPEAKVPVPQGFEVIVQFLQVVPGGVHFADLVEQPFELAGLYFQHQSWFVDPVSR